MHYQKLFDSEYLGAWNMTDDEDQPVDKSLTIDRIEKKVIKSQRGEETKPVIYFRGVPKPMICNKTNARMIAGMHGVDVAKWTGKRITLYQATTTTKDGDVPCIRVRPTAPPDQPTGKKGRGGDGL